MSTVTVEAVLKDWHAVYRGHRQACLILVASTQGTRCKPGWREPLDTMIHWETWEVEVQTGHGREGEGEPHQAGSLRNSER